MTGPFPCQAAIWVRWWRNTTALLAHRDTRHPQTPDQVQAHALTGLRDGRVVVRPVQSWCPVLLGRCTPRCRDRGQMAAGLRGDRGVER